ncbi:membrane protein YqaA, SNARE-associated domain [Desulfocicer vacuolatum DSM 3385]|uniref:Membrane protein YqaA, SNARE-associated domain n=1 Tax=Desulfocicer vacuolatum DSM 3385 TaxID=1121400 RepID=A0A1W1YKX6_9BACT|nr:YqaA family protein [Desulfocicer vacuolatum]SMC36783.1 membrane protein YqaA, SNARE-associated domain [Desulfocicer vacuolatum DSM 3385]
MDFFLEHGYWGQFISSFMAATILPLSSEVVLTLLLANYYDPVATIAVATLGNVLGSVLNYAMGFWGRTMVVKRVLKISDKEIDKATRRFSRHGVFSLFFAWVPIIGDPLTVVAGALRVNGLIFLSLVTTGKLLRYIVVGYAAM